MRLWSLHPQYLDSRGLVALWREALLARRAPKLRERWGSVKTPRPHSLFRVVEGGVAGWERP